MQRRQGPSALVGLPTGVLAALVGLLPWLVTGARAPLQNLWANGTLPADMPRVLLPFSQYHLTGTIGMLVTGGALAGLAARVLWRRSAVRGALATLGGVLLVQLLAVAQTVLEINAGLLDGTEADLYLAVVTGVALAAVLVGAVALLLVALAPRAGAVVGLAVGAMALGPWLSEFPLALSLPARWLPPALVGAAVAWGGLRSVGWVLAALVGLLLVWLVPALTTALQASFGSRALLRDVAGLAEYFARVLSAAATNWAVAGPPLLVAVGVAAAGLVLARRGRRVG